MAEGDVRVYGNGIKNMMNGAIDVDTDTIKAALVTGYTFSQAHDFWDDVSANEESGTGYTAGGVTVTMTVSFTVANSWATAWASATAYSVGDVVRPTSGNGYVYRCIVAGTSAGSEPSWSTTLGDNVTDNTAEWEVWGTGVVALDSSDPSWTGLDIGTPGACVWYEATGTASTSGLIAYMELGSTATNGGNYSITVDSAGLYLVAVS